MKVRVFIGFVPLFVRWGLCQHSWLARAAKGGGRLVRVEVVEVFEQAGSRSGLCVDGAPGAGEGGGAFDVVTAAGEAGDTEVDTGGNQGDGNRGHIAVNDRRVTPIES